MTHRPDPLPPLPPYDRLQSSFHRAFRPDLARLIGRLQIPPQGQVLDVPCGNGFYAELLARHLPTGAHLTAVDQHPGYVALTQERLADLSTVATAVPGDAYALPFPSDTFDLLWCGQSLISLEDPERVFQEFVRVLKPGGVIAIWESDEFHHVLLPWPVRLEVVLQRALLQASRARYGSGGKLAAGRTVRRRLMSAGFRAVRRETISLDRVAPFGRAERVFLQRHLRFLRDLVRPRMEGADQELFDSLADPTRETSFVRSVESEMTCLGTLHTGRKVLIARSLSKVA